MYGWMDGWLAGWMPFQSSSSGVPVTCVLPSRNDDEDQILMRRFELMFTPPHPSHPHPPIPNNN